MPNVNLDPRIAPMFRGRPPHEQFLAAAMCAILGAMPNREPEKPGKNPKAAPKNMLDQVISQFAAHDIDWTEVVAGKPLIHWNAKHRGQVEGEAGVKGADAVDAALKARGLALPADPKPKPPATGPQPPQDNAHVAPGATPFAETDESLVSPDERAEPTFAGYPLSELAGKSDAELLKKEGISLATIKDIRVAEKK